MKRDDWRRILLIAALAAVTLSLHYGVFPGAHALHDLLRRLCYVPILLGAFWFGVRGGIATAAAVSLALVPYLVEHWGHGREFRVSELTEIAFYLVIGGLVGVLVARERAGRSERDLLEAELHRAERMGAIGELTAGLAHEVRNPLGSIRGTAEILKDALPPSDRHREFLDILVREVNRLDRAVGDVLRFARQSPLRESAFDLVGSLERVLALVSGEARRSRVTLDLKVPPSVPFRGDDEKLTQVFLNLALNAVQAMTPGGGRLEVSVRQRDEAVEIDFADTGPGVPGEHLSRLFTPFFTTREGGTGLGLSLSRRIVEAHGGTIAIVGPPPGARFRIRLPTAGVATARSA